MHSPVNWPEGHIYYLTQCKHDCDLVYKSQLQGVSRSRVPNSKYSNIFIYKAINAC